MVDRLSHFGPANSCEDQATSPGIIENGSSAFDLLKRSSKVTDAAIELTALDAESLPDGNGGQIELGMKI